MQVTPLNFRCSFQLEQQLPLHLHLLKKSLGIILGLALLFAFIDELGDVQGKYGLGEALSYVMLTAPRRAYEMLPMAALIGSLIGLGSLASNSELTIMRAAGASIGRIVWAVMKPLLVLMLAGILLGEYLADWEEVYKQSKRAYKAKSTEAMEIGTLVHEAIELWIQSNGKLKTEELENEHQKLGLQAFLAWGEEHSVEIVDNERIVSDNQTYAGRFDLLAFIDGKLTLLDFKTSTGIWDEYWLQTAGYADCLSDVEQVAVLRIDKHTGELEYQSKKNWQPYAKAFKLLSLS